MDTFEPLVELRGEWRQAAAISVPAAAAQVAAALDRALDVLLDADQVDDESLTMAAETVCKAVVARPDEVELLRRRLHRAIRDFVTATAIEDAPTSADGGAFDSEEALVAALFASVGNSIGADDEVPEPVARTSTGKRIDEKALRRSLDDRPAKTRRALVGFFSLIIPLALVAVAVFYVLKTPQTVVQQGPPPSTQSGDHQGTFTGDNAECTGGTPGSGTCNWPFVVQQGGSLALNFSWDSTDRLGLALIKSDGTPLQPIAVETGPKPAAVEFANVPSGSYTLQISNAGHAAGTIHFSVSAP